MILNVFISFIDDRGRRIYFLNMFNIPRWHRLLTIPALLVAIAVLFLGPYPLYALAICPIAVALPFQLHAAHKRDVTAIGAALTATRVVGYLGLAWGLLVTAMVPAAGLIMLSVFVSMLFAAGTIGSEPRLAIVMMIESIALGLAGVPLVWLGAVYVIAVPTGFVLFCGALWWLIEAARAPITAPRDEAELPIAIAV